MRVSLLAAGRPAGGDYESLWPRRQVRRPQQSQRDGSLEKGDIDVGLIFSSDAAIPAKGFVVLEDDKHLQNADVVVPVIRTKVATNDVKSVLDDVSAKLTTTDLTNLNKRALIDKEDPDKVGASWAKDHGFSK